MTRLDAVTTRRAALKAVGAAALALPVALSGRDAEAIRTWCKVDPIVRIGNQLADIWLSSTVEMLLSATGPVQLVVTVPPGVATGTVLSDLGFGRGYKISFAQSADLIATSKRIPFRVAAFAPAGNGSLPVKVEVTPRLLGLGLLGLLKPASATGTANAWITLSAS